MTSDVFYLKYSISWQSICVNNYRDINVKLYIIRKIFFRILLDIFINLAYNNIAGRNALYTCVTELTLKRYVMPPVTGTAIWRFFYWQVIFLNIFVYSDESGVFDKIHNDIFVFGGLILIDKQQKEICSREYSAAERVFYNNGKVKPGEEIKASRISNDDKNKLYRSLNKWHKFGVVINQQSVLDRIFKSKKDKQRYLDYAYKIGVKHAFKQMIKANIINPDKIDNIHFYVDEHTTATNGRYELREALEQELIRGTYNIEYSVFYDPILSKAKNVQLDFCNSATATLVRAADIIANKIYYIALNGGNFENEIKNRNMYITFLP